MAWSRDISRQISLAYEAGDLAEVERLFKQHAVQLRSKDGGDIWMWSAALRGNLEMLKLLVKFGMDVNETKYLPDNEFFEPEGPILQAAGEGFVKIVQWFLDHGAQINFNFKGQKRCMPLVRAATYGHLDVVKLLVEHGADIDAIDGGAFAVTQADVYGQFAVRDYLLSVGAKDLRDITPPDFPKAHKAIIDAMVEGRGPLADWRVEIPGDPAVTVHLIRANELCDHDTLFTTGLSDKNLPVGQYRFTHHELRIMLKPGWPLSDEALKDPRHNWPVEWLKRIVRELLAGDRWPEEPILFMNGDPPKPLAPKTKLCGWICLQSMGEVTELGDERIANIHSLFPIHDKEAKFVRQHGANELVERFHDRGIPIHLDPKRKSIV